jgi:hypothetical protein
MLKKRFGHLALATSVLACWSVNADELHPPSVPAEITSNGSGTVSIPCVLLQNDNVLFGHAHQVGEFVVVRTGQGGEVQLPRKEVVCWADSLRNLYRYRVDHRQSDDLTAHLRDARWCLQNDLFDLAAAEIRSINQMDPGNAQAQSIEEQLQRLTAPRSAANANLFSQPSSVQPAGFIDPSPEQGTVDLATLRRFASQVQPMLLNRCGRCHSRDSGRGWTLNTPSVGARASSRMTRENITASLPYIDRIAYEKSELLVKATTPHGGGPAPLDPHSEKAIWSLKGWLATASNGMPNPSIAVADHSNVDGQTSTPAPPVAAYESPSDAPSPSLDHGDQPARLPQVANPFDPDLFNRRFHPDSSSK